MTPSARAWSVDCKRVARPARCASHACACRRTSTTPTKRSTTCWAASDGRHRRDHRGAARGARRAHAGGGVARARRRVPRPDGLDAHGRGAGAGRRRGQRRVSLHYSSLLEVSDLMKSRKLSPVELTRATLERIDRLNPGLGAYYAVFGDKAMAEAEVAESEIA